MHEHSPCWSPLVPTKTFILLQENQCFAFPGPQQTLLCCPKSSFSCRKINVLRSQTLNKSSHVPQNLYWRFVSHQSIDNLPTGVLEAQRAREVVCLGLELHGSARHECGARRVGLQGPPFPRRQLLSTPPPTPSPGTRTRGLRRRWDLLLRLFCHLVALRFFIVFSMPFLNDLGSILPPNWDPKIHQNR